MKIQDTYLAGTGSAQLERSAATQPVAPPPQDTVGTKTGPSDTVKLSSLSQRLMEAAAGRSPEHLARLERLQGLLRAGRYQVDAMALARRLVEEALARQP